MPACKTEDLRSLRELERENGQLKRLLAERDLEIDAVRALFRFNRSIDRILPVTWHFCLALSPRFLEFLQGMELTEAKALVGCETRITWKDRKGEALTQSLRVYAAGFIPLYGPCLVTDAGQIRLDRVVTWEPGQAAA